MARSRRTPAMLVGRCSWELSGRELQRRIKSHILRPGFPVTLRWTRLRVRLSSKERRVSSVNDTKFHRKSGGAEPPCPALPPVGMPWRDLQFHGPLLETLNSTFQSELPPRHPHQKPTPFPYRDNRIYDAQGTIQFSTRPHARTVAMYLLGEKPCELEY
jgi:hypothetical protein